MAQYIFMAVAIVAITYILGYRIGNNRGFKEGAEYVKDVYDDHMNKILNALKEGGIDAIPRTEANSPDGTSEKSSEGTP